MGPEPGQTGHCGAPSPRGQALPLPPPWLACPTLTYMPGFLPGVAQLPAQSFHMGTELALTVPGRFLLPMTPTPAGRGPRCLPSCSGELWP